MDQRTFTAILEQDGDGYLSLCPELDVASQGGTLEEALANLKEAVTLFIECAGQEERQARMRGPVLVTHFQALIHAS